MIDPAPASTPASRERLLVFLLCGLAALRVFVYSAAFPFFNPIDEEFHFDLVVRYAHLDPPRELAGFCEEARPAIVVFGSMEYYFPPERFPGGAYPEPPWIRPTAVAQSLLAKNELAVQAAKNHEAAQPPLYYTLAGLFWRAGRACHLDEGMLLYGIRFLNMFALAATVWLGYAVARLLFPDREFLRLGVPALLAFLPQSIFCCIQNDVLLPVGFGVVFLGLVRWLRGDLLTLRLAAIIGLGLAALYLTKLTCLPLLGVGAAAIGLKLWQLAKAGTLRNGLPALGTMAACAAVPVIAWAAWVKHVFGDLTGSAAKVQFLTWTYKPFGEWWHHPIFTPQGFWTFLSRLLSTFWQGEMTWQDRSMTFPAINSVYALLSIGFIGLALAALWSKSSTLTRPQRLALWLGLASVAASVAFLGFLSIIYDFNKCVYPSRAHPYFTSGRLMLGAMIPFALLLVQGMDWSLGRIKVPGARPFALVALILFMLIMETITNWPVFSSQYNWYHM